MPDVASLINPPFIAAMVVPTGIGASVGGFAGDATPAMNLIASCCDLLITHPNVANAAIFQKLPANAWYVEGYALDQFFKAQWALVPSRQNKIGVVLDSGIPDEMRILHRNVISAVQAVYGVEIIAVEETNVPVRIDYSIQPSGCSSGELKNPEAILDAAEKLKTKGANAIALCIFFPDGDQCADEEAAYRQGTGVDPVGGVEAILSHLVVSTLKLPAANSPVFSKEASMPEFGELIDPKSAAEYLAPTFLPCVLQGLSKAPAIIDLSQLSQEKSPFVSAVDISQLSALVIPADCLGGIPALACLAQNIPVIAVSGNQTVCDITADDFKFSETDSKTHRIYSAANYTEAAGLLMAMRQGLSPSSLGYGAFTQGFEKEKNQKLLLGLS